MAIDPPPPPPPPPAPPAPGPEHWARVRALFDEVSALPAEQRAGFLAALTLPEAVRAEVSSLLAHLPADDTGGAGFLSTPAMAHDASPHASRTGQRLGAWRISAPLGTGGMSEVWQAERADGAFDAPAALKLLKPGMDSSAVLERFALEQRTLARLQHPNIAHLLDAGRSADGLPFFVMELVRGQAIDRACEGRPLAERLKLFLQLTDAVAHAHRHLLVHRDLKPSNVLVTDDGQVKLLDFGIAKAIDPLEAGDASLTAAGQRPYTPHYASPEQVRGEPISTATDVYSLGVLLYVMLTGQRPYGRTATTPREAVRAVLEEDPTRPSALSSPGPQPDPAWVATRRRLQGDLDNILLKALEKPQDRRYASVDALAADVRAFLNDQPVSARPQSLGYLLGKLVRRNRVAFGALGLGLAGLVGGLGLSLWQGHEAALARDAARQQLAGVKQIASELVFRYGDAIALLPGGAQTQESMLQQTVAALDVTLQRAPDDPGLNVLVAQALGRLAQLQGNPAFASPERAGQADATVARALALADKVWDSQHGDWRFASQHLITLLTQAQLLRGRGQPAEGLKSLALAARRADQALADKPPDAGRAGLLDLRANLWINHAHFHDHVGRPSLGRPREALQFYDKAEADFRTLYGDPQLMQAMAREAAPGDPSTAEWGRHNLANVHAGRALVLQRLDDDAGMRREAEAALALRRQNLAANPKNVTWRQTHMFDSNTLAIALLRLGQAGPALAAAQAAWDEAGALLREAGADSPWAATRANFSPQYGRALAGNGRHADALPVYDIGLARLREQRAQADGSSLRMRLAWLMVQRARSQAALGQVAASDAEVAQALALLDGVPANTAAPTRELQGARAEALALRQDLQRPP
ncbi:serine/threonine protein kinase [Burkholderiales bacterium JOSHI_001]|nr:serine/threonine protein kinase [Burkholderiales bacterium JOSHI_001]